MIIQTVKLNLKTIFISIITFVLMLSLILGFIFFSNNFNTKQVFSNNENLRVENRAKKDYIKWVDFKITYEALDKTSKLDINSHNNNEQIKYNWIELLAYLACKNGGDFKNFKPKDLDDLTRETKKW